ncbi:MAG: polyamine aminopropyltransferase [Syntrophobacterales bacterium]|nr:polyamine aminopropyltransferase [Syntrophobacterales bacterium]
MNNDLYFYEPITMTMKRGVKINTILHARQSPYQLIEVVETEDYGRVLFLDRRFQTSEREEFFYHESLVHPAMMTHENPQKVLIVGGGDGGALEEVLKYPTVTKVTVVELDGEVVEVSKLYLSSVCGDAFSDPRVSLVIEDGRKFLENTKDYYDIIILDLTDPMEPSKYVYTKEFYEICRNRLTPGGILSLHNDSPFFYPEAFNVITKTVRSIFPYCSQFINFIPGYLFDFAFAICSSLPFPALTLEELRDRFERRNLGELLWYSPERHLSLFVMPGYAKKILEVPCAVSTDTHPYTIKTPSLDEYVL